MTVGEQVAVPAEVAAGLASAGVDLLPTCTVQRDFPWSCVLRLEDVGGRTSWAKRVGPGMVFEPALTRLLDGLDDPLLVPVLWSDQHWIATAHAGDGMTRGDHEMLPTMRDLQAPYARLQRSIVDRAEDLRAAGVPSLLPEDVPRLLDEGIEQCRSRAQLGERPLTADDAGVVRRAASRLQDALTELAGGDDVLVLQHLDLHHGNVFLTDGRPLVLDWGDARIAAPLVHVVSTTSLLAHVVGCEVDDPRITDVVRAYADAWPERKITPQQWGLTRDARVAALIRADALVAAFRDAPDASVEQFADWLPDVLRAASADSAEAARGVRLA